MISRRLVLIVLCSICLSLGATASAWAQAQVEGVAFVRERYTKQEQLVPMRDGIKLFTSIYTPKDTSRKCPILLLRTPYSVRPYGKDQYRGGLGPSHDFDMAGYIFVFQDVRGCYMSEGN